MSNEKRKCPRCGTTIPQFENICQICHSKVDLVDKELVTIKKENMNLNEDIESLCLKIIEDPVGITFIQDYAKDYSGLDYWKRYVKALVIYKLNQFDEKKQSVSMSNGSIIIVSMVGCFLVFFFVLIMKLLLRMPQSSENNTELGQVVEDAANWIFFPIIGLFGFLILFLVIGFVYYFSSSINVKNKEEKRLFDEFSAKCDTTKVTEEMYQELANNYPEFKRVCEKVGIDIRNEE